MSAEIWHWLDTGAHDAAMNMAVDETLLQGAEQRAAPLFRVYGWTRPSISIGYFQQYPSDYQDDYAIVRRPTGGGLVWHGKDLTFTVVVPRSHALYRLCAGESYSALHEMIARALNRAGICCALQEGKSAAAMGACFQLPVAHDIVIGTKKIAGGAQRRTRFGLLHQGSLLLPPSQRRPLEELRPALREGLGIAWRDIELTPSERSKAVELCRSKYATDAWNKKFTG